MKLATELSKRSTGSTVYVLDEPTTGLHTFDVQKLITILDRLTDAGNTVVVIDTTWTSSKLPTTSSTSVPRAATAAAR